MDQPGGENFQALPLGDTDTAERSSFLIMTSPKQVLCEFLTPLYELEEGWLLVTGTLTMALETGFDFR